MWLSALDYVKTRCVSLVLVFVVTLMMVASLIVTSYLAYYVRDHSGFYIRSFNSLFSLVIFSLVFAVAYLYLPRRRIDPRRAILGGLITSFLFVAGKEVIALYFSSAAFSSVYGAAGSLVVTLCWIYYSSLVLFVGAQVTKLIHFKGNKYSVAIESPTIM